MCVRAARQQDKKDRKRERDEGDPTAATGGSVSADDSEGSKRTKTSAGGGAAPPSSRPSPPDARNAAPRRAPPPPRAAPPPPSRSQAPSQRARSPPLVVAPPVSTRPSAPLGAPPVIPLSVVVGRGFVVEPHPPPLTAALIGRRVAMKGVGHRGESWCWGIIKQFYKPPTREGWNVEVGWGGGSNELRDCRLHHDTYCAEPEDQAELPDAWVILRKV